MTKSKLFVIFLFLFIGVVALLYITGGVEMSHTQQTREPVNPIGRLTVDLELGAIDIETTDDHHVDIAMKKEWNSTLRISRLKWGKWIHEMLGDFEITIEHNDSDTESDIRIKGKFKRGQEYWQEKLKWFKVEVQITVPRQYNLMLKTASRGDIHVGNLAGTVRAEALGGNLHLGEIQGDVWGKTGGSGDITLKGCQSSVSLTTATGDIRAEMTTQPQHLWTLHASKGGDIDVTLHSDIAVDIDAQTQGNISNDFAVQFQGDIKENRLKGTLNGGGPLLKLHSSAGEIRLRRK